MSLASKPPARLASRPTPASSSRMSTPVAAPSGSSKDTSSSSGKVFAKPSKEWVLPERAKPGRKVSVEEPDSKRQSQNRLSQRAHRARRTDYISTLEERIRQFENDEIHSNVRLQEVARALKADNERLKSEVLSLKSAESGAPKGWEEERGMLLAEIRTLREQVATGVRGLSCPICPNPDPDCPCQRPHAYDLALPVATLSPPTHSCGFCSSSDECLCRAVEDVKPIILTPPSGTMRLEGCGLCADGGFCACAVRNSPNSSQAEGVTSAAVPLRKPKTAAKKSVWMLDSGITPAGPSTAATRAEAQCTGDPRNCDACRNDAFGQEFCENFYTEPAAKSSSTLGNYWKVDEEEEEEETRARPELIMACCGDSKLCGHQTGGCSGDVIGIGGLIPGVEQAAEHETVRVDQAWKTLKAHPNAKFASLAFLADLVAQRAPSRAGTPASASPARPTVQRSLTAGSAGAERKGKRKAALVDQAAVRDALKALDDVDSADEGAMDRSKRIKL